MLISYLPWAPVQSPAGHRGKRVALVAVRLELIAVWCGVVVRDESTFCVKNFVNFVNICF